MCSLGCGPKLKLPQDAIQKQADHCNDRKTASKRVQELSAELFFSVFVKVSLGAFCSLHQSIQEVAEWNNTKLRTVS